MEVVIQLFSLCFKLINIYLLTCLYTWFPFLPFKSKYSYKQVKKVNQKDVE